MESLNYYRKNRVNLLSKQPNIEENYLSRYKYSHYDIDLKVPSKIANCNSHYDNLYNLNVTDSIRKKLFDIMPVKLSDNVLEIGAFEGFGTIKLSKLAKKGKVFAIEVDKQSYNILKLNLRLNNCFNVIPINKGIYKNAQLRKKLYSNGREFNSFNNNCLRRIIKCKYVNSNTIDDILHKYTQEEIN